MIMRMIAVAALVAVSSAALAQDRLECRLRGDDWLSSDYPDGIQQTWWIDGDKLQQAPRNSGAVNVPGLAWMRILKRDDDTLIAE